MTLFVGDASMTIRAQLPTTPSASNLTAHFLLWCYGCKVARLFLDDIPRLKSERQSNGTWNCVRDIRNSVIDA